MLRSPTAFLFALAAACGTPPAPAPEAPATGRVERVVQLRHVKAEVAVESLMLLPAPYQVSLTAKNDGSLIVAGDARSVDEVLKAIAKVDVPAR